MYFYYPDTAGSSFQCQLSDDDTEIEYLEPFRREPPLVFLAVLRNEIAAACSTEDVSNGRRD